MLSLVGPSKTTRTTYTPNTHAVTFSPDAKQVLGLASLLLHSKNALFTSAHSHPMIFAATINAVESVDGIEDGIANDRRRRPRERARARRQKWERT